MKKNLIYLMSFLFSVSLIFVGCDEEDTSYADLTIDTNSLSLDKDTEGEIHITNGNGNYIVSSANESVAEATIEGNTIKVKGITRGTTTITIQDWAKHIQQVSVKVNEIVDLKLGITEYKADVFLGSTKSIPIFSGNPEYTLTPSDPSIVKAEIDKNNIILTPLKKGETTVTLTDAANKSLSIAVQIVNEFVLDIKSSDINIGLNEDTNINILSGNGGYKFSGNAMSYCKAEVVDNILTITGTKINKANTNRYDLIITDEKNQKITLKIFPDCGFLSDPSLRIRDFKLMSNGQLYYGNECTSSAVYYKDVNMSYARIETEIWGMGLGWAISFEGTLTKGKKTNARRMLLLYGSSAGSSEEIKLEDLEIVQVKDKTYWVTYTDPGLKREMALVFKEK